MKRWLFVLLFSVLSPASLAQSDDDYLDVSIRVFRSAEPQSAASSTAANASTQTVAAPVTPEVRVAETRYLPMFLRYRLEASGLFGAVRVLPENRQQRA
ncbi:MAG: hypothetical protein SV422_12240, partial [Pseudomonadota bacterium]|nr:hypothetical protein [Pseudomonadota bacterium]